MSARYREAFRETLCGRVPDRHPSRNFRRNSDRYNINHLYVNNTLLSHLSIDDRRFYFSITFYFCGFYLLFDHCIVTYIDLQVHPIENLTVCAFNI